MQESIDLEFMEFLRRVPTPSLANAIELFDLRPRTEGYTGSHIQCRFPGLGAIVGFAATVTTTAASPGVARVDPAEYWRYVYEAPKPTISVVHDVDSPIAGAQWGEVQANIHLALGCVGAVTDGAVRDLEEVEALGFSLFSRTVSVSHGYARQLEFGVPVSIDGLEVNSGDLIVADVHGVLKIPLEVAPRLPEAVRLIDEWEQEFIEETQRSPLELDRLVDAYKRPRPTLDSLQDFK